MLVRLFKMEFEIKKKGKANPPICSWVTRNKMSFFMALSYYNLSFLIFAYFALPKELCIMNHFLIFKLKIGIEH